MTESKRVLGSDLAQVDAHAIQPHEYDELPEWTDEMFDKAEMKVDGRPAAAGARRRP